MTTVSFKHGYACAAAMFLATGCLAIEKVDDVAPTMLPKAPHSRGGSSGDVVAEPPEIEYVQILAGAFTMGSPSDEAGREDDEAPQHEVSISGFELGKYEVTNAQYAVFLDAHPNVAKPQNWNFALPTEAPSSTAAWGDEPATGMTWDEAMLFAMWVGARLPTEAEWEYAARAGTAGSRYGELDDVAWYSGNARGVKHAVGTKLSNAWGVYDMLGNVYEWCWDKYAYYEAELATNPQGATSGASRVLRGGSFADLSISARAGNRSAPGPGHRTGDIGFRVVRLQGQED